MMAVNPATRLSAKQALNHPWIKNSPRHSLDQSLLSRIINNLRNFHWEKKLQKATLSFIVSQLATKEEKEDLLEIFKVLDKDNNGTLSRQEIAEGIGFFSRGLGLEQEVDRIMAQVDIDGSGEIDYSEFVAATVNKSTLLSRERLEIAFKLYDTENRGSISKDQLKAIFGKHYSHEDSFWESMINEVDKNQDGVIDIYEFSDMMLSLANN
jgi:calcium-dependent protein kinase